MGEVNKSVGMFGQNDIILLNAAFFLVPSLFRLGLCGRVNTGEVVVKVSLYLRKISETILTV